MADEERRVEAILGAGIDRASWQKAVAEAKQMIKDLANTIGATYEEAARLLETSGQIDTTTSSQALKELNKDFQDVGDAATEAFDKVEAGSQQSGKQLNWFQRTVGNVKSAFSNLGQVGKVVFGTVLGMSAITVVRRLIDSMKELVNQTLEYQKALFKLSVGIRAMQRLGMDVHIKDVTDKITELSEKFSIFSRRDLVQGMAQASLLTRELDLTKEQLFELVDASATISMVMGRDMNEVLRTTALTMSSGYSEGLQKLGININKAVITERAHQMGIEKSYMAMTQKERALASLNLVVEQANRLSEDAVKYEETAPGRADSLKAAWADLSMTLGNKFAPILGSLAENLARFLGTLDRGIIAAEQLGVILFEWHPIGKIVSSIYHNILMLTNALVGLFETISPEYTLKDWFDTFIKDWKGGVEMLRQETRETIFPNIFQSMLGDADIGDFSSESEEAIESFTDASEEMANAFKDEMESLVNEVDDIYRDYYRDLEKYETDYRRDLEEAARNLERDLADLRRDAARDRADASRDYYRKLADIDRDYENKKQEMIEENNDRLEKEERKFQEKMRQLREEFLFDMDEAIRLRDARQALNLIKRYNLDRTQATREHELRMAELQSSHEDELKELANQRAEKRRDAWIDFQQRLEDIQIQYEQRREDAEIKHRQELEDLRRQLQEKREERKIMLEQELEDLRLGIEERLRMIVDGLQEEYNLTEEGLRQIYNLYKKYLEAFNDMATSITNTTSGGAGATDLGGFAKGGSFIATSPVTATFGEGGQPELVTAIPLSSPTAVPNVAYPMSSSGRLALQIFLSSGLRAEIVEESLGQMADVFISSERERV